MRDFRKENENFSFRAWPPKSRDINPFATIWKEFESGIRLLRFQPNSADDLFERIQDLWEFRARRPGYWKGLMDILQINLKTLQDRKGDNIE